MQGTWWCIKLLARSVNNSLYIIVGWHWTPSWVSHRDDCRKRRSVSGGVRRLGVYVVYATFTSSQPTLRLRVVIFNLVSCLLPCPRLRYTHLYMLKFGTGVLNCEWVFSKEKRPRPAMYGSKQHVICWKSKCWFYRESKLPRPMHCFKFPWWKGWDCWY